MSKALSQREYLGLILYRPGFVGKGIEAWPYLCVNHRCLTLGQLRNSDLEGPDSADGFEARVVSQSVDDGDAHKRLASHRPRASSTATASQGSIWKN